MVTAERESFVRVGVAVVVRRAGGEVLLGLRRGGNGAGTWSVPGGSLEPGETVAQCAVRELLEETGLVVPPLAVLPLGFTDASYDAEDGRSFTTLYVLAGGLSHDEPRVVEPDKCERWEWCREAPGPLFTPLARAIAERGRALIWGGRS